jgi:ascorbate-specific PTS system EIIC-type component UlaA
LSRNRIFVIAGVLIVFVVVGGILIYANRSGGGKPVTFNVTVTGATTMKPDSLSAHQNDTITINVTSDTDGEVHLHVYDIVFAAKAGQVVSHTFKADKTCGCDIEWESTSHALGSLTVSP